ncbi:hypothetical protein RIF29_35212 [Crotalaria pallida]|uniref:Uncharacterized protein n=1 Tax=Crotalaria pallida TaxID=3830 RepID=A0AAN9EAW7_CROPI
MPAKRLVWLRVRWERMPLDRAQGYVSIKRLMSLALLHQFFKVVVTIGAFVPVVSKSLAIDLKNDFMKHKSTANPIAHSKHFASAWFARRTSYKSIQTAAKGFPA